MSIQKQIPALETLSDLDEKLRQIEEELTSRRGGLEAVRSEADAVAGRIASSKNTIVAMEKTRSELLTEVRQMTVQIEKSREKLSRSRNERETNAAEREAEELKRLIKDRQHEADKIETLAEQARKTVDMAEKRRTELDRELEGTEDGAALALAEREATRTELIAQRAEAVKAVPPALYRRYETIRARRPKAIAATTNGTCKGCFIAVPPMMFQKLQRMEEFDQCPNCRRLIYFSPAVQS